MQRHMIFQNAAIVVVGQLYMSLQPSSYTYTFEVKIVGDVEIGSEGERIDSRDTHM